MDAIVQCERASQSITIGKALLWHLFDSLWDYYVPGQLRAAGECFLPQISERFRQDESPIELLASRKGRASDVLETAGQSEFTAELTSFKSIKTNILQRAWQFELPAELSPSKRFVVNGSYSLWDDEGAGEVGAVVKSTNAYHPQLLRQYYAGNPSVASDAVQTVIGQGYLP